MALKLEPFPIYFGYLMPYIKELLVQKIPAYKLSKEVSVNVERLLMVNYILVF